MAMTLMSELRRLLRLPEPYRRRDFDARERWRDAYGVLADSLLRTLEFESVIDVGCANGFLLSRFLDAGRDVRGIELSPAVRDVLPPELQSRVDVGDFVEAEGEWDLVCCVEVAEHVPRRRSEDLVATLCRLTRRSIYFTAAPPGQSGHGHINCRPREEWLELFSHRGWTIAAEPTQALFEELERLPAAPWLRDNGMVLEPALKPSERTVDVSGTADSSAEPEPKIARPESEPELVGSPA